jgi:hypothetical protein
MAQLKKTVLGKVSGAVGDIVFREREGKNYIGLRPGSFIPGTDPASVARRQRFLLTLKTGSSINSIDKLKSLWKEVTPSGLSPFNYIVKKNYRFITSTDLTNLLQLTPDNGFGFVVTDSNVDRVRIRVSIDPIGNNAGINSALEPNIMMICLVFLSNPVDPSMNVYALMSLTSALQHFDLVTPLNLDANLTNQQQVVFDNYQVTKAFVALVTLDADGIPVHYSSTALLV